MMQKFLLSLCLILCSTLLFAKPISKSEAQIVGQNYYLSHASRTDLSVQLSLVQVVNTNIFNIANGAMESIPVYYVFNVNSQDGFVIVTADDAAIPVLGYATEGSFDPSIKASNFEKWMEDYREQLRYIIENNIPSTPEITEQWETLRKGTINFNGRSISTVGALLGPIKWNQSPVWNDLCPYDNAAGERSVVGCVATAMAQIMKYWAHPAQGTGFHSYNHSTYGTQSANYGSTTYNWASMPNTVGSSESAKLSYHCGVAVDMMYSPDGSGAYSEDAATAFHTYFGYKTTLQYVARSNYTTSSWKAMLKTDLDASRPLYYAGTGSGGGHAFVCDGYDASDNFHYNWGWGGAYDGFFSVDALNPSGVGTGGGSGGFNSNHRAIRGIEPLNGGGGGSGVDLYLYSNISSNPTSPITYGTNFTISVDIANTSGTNYTGDVTAALLDDNNNFVAYIETKTGVTYNTGNYYSPTFSSSNMTTTPVPGNYRVVLYQKQTGAANWKAIGNGSYTNSLPITIQAVNSGGMNLYAAIVPSVTDIVLGQAFTITTNFYNTSASNFAGKFSIDLHDMQGNWIMTIQEQTQSLSAGFVFSNPGIVFSNSGITSLTAGTYQMAAWMQPTGGNWELVGSGGFSNPILIDIVEPALSGDIYENNNTAGTAYNLSPVFLSTSATVSTPGSNISSGSDYDFFRVYLPPGYSYFIDAEVLDSYNTASGFSNDVLFSFDTGNGYSESYDNSFGSIVLPNGGTVTFQVASYYQGQTGNYEFRATINRGAVAIDKIEDDNTLRLYPIPANNMLTLEFEAAPENLNEIEIFNALGQKIQSITGYQLQEQIQNISTQDWNSGMYWMLLHTDGNITRKSFVVTH